MDNKHLILVGGGGHCKSVIEIAEKVGYTILGILDLPNNLGEKILGHEIIGIDDEMVDFVARAKFLVTVGHMKNASLRISLHEKITAVEGKLATIVAHTSQVSRYAQIGDGSVIMHCAIVNAGASIGRGCIINTLANIEHDVIIGDYCHVSTGAMINGDCSIGRDTFIGSQAVLVNGIHICEGAVVAAGAVVKNSIFHRGIYAGNPACLKREF